MLSTSTDVNEHMEVKSFNRFNGTGLHKIDRKKRMYDLIVASLVTLLILCWLVPLVGLAIVLNSPGPPFYIQLRTGRTGRRFYCMKFRTMYHDRNSVFRQATRNDPRVTRLGKFLRKTNLDEMPQFLNVLIGDMSIVGPRPHAVHHDQQFLDKLPNYLDRYNIKPGITGLAQVRGNRGGTTGPWDMEHRLKYDRFYIKNQSLGLDLKICWLTLLHMITDRTNAY